MNGELMNMRHSLRQHIFWGVLYLTIITLFVFGIYKLGNRVKTYNVPTGQIQLNIPYATYLVGEAVSFSIKNNFNSPVFFLNNCPNEPLQVYRQINGKWVRQHDQASSSDCSSEQRQLTVPANGVVNGSFAPWHHLFSQPGKYLVTAYVEFYDTLPYQEFEVIATPPIKPAVASIPTPSGPTSSPSPAPSSTRSPAPAPPPTPVVDPPPYTPKQSKTITTSQGTIAVQYDTTTIYVISIAPATGCTYQGGNSGQQVQVTFICNNSETQIQLSIVNGQLTQNIQTRSRDN